MGKETSPSYFLSIYLQLSRTDAHAERIRTFPNFMALSGTFAGVFEIIRLQIWKIRHKILKSKAQFLSLLQSFLSIPMLNAREAFRRYLKGEYILAAGNYVNASPNYLKKLALERNYAATLSAIALDDLYNILMRSVQRIRYLPSDSMTRISLR
jgi:hypothetical protein